MLSGTGPTSPAFAATEEGTYVVALGKLRATRRGRSLLQTLLAYCRGAGLDVRWLVIQADPDSFAITKRIPHWPLQQSGRRRRASVSISWPVGDAFVAYLPPQHP